MTAAESSPIPTTPLDEVPAPIRAALERFEAGDRVGLARAISIVENERPGFQALLDAVLRRGPRARRIGMTGPPGAGKSSLVAALAHRYRAVGEEVGIVAVDPTSPFSGGALLGDRIRMNELTTDPGIFIRSMATRGSLGGLATTTREVIDLMDAFGFPRLIVETVGVGQTELEITAAADTVVVVLVPESGDGVQAMKAGLMEIADIFVVNKADRPGADRLVKEISLAVHLREGGGRAPSAAATAHHGVDLGAAADASGDDAPSQDGRDEADASSARSARAPSSSQRGRRWEKPTPEEMDTWRIPVVKTVAQSGEGVDRLVEALDEHRRFLAVRGELERRRRLRAERRIRDVLQRELRRLAWDSEERRTLLAQGAAQVSAGQATPYSVSRELMAHVLRSPGGAERGEE